MDERPMRAEVQGSHRRLQALLDEALSDGGLASDRADEVLQELSATLEELRVAEEELTVQGKQLAASADVIDAERQRYAELFDFAPDGYVETDEMGKVVEANEAAAVLFDVSPRSFVERLLVSFVGADDRRSFRRLVNDAVEGEVRGERIIPMTTRDGTEFVAGVRDRCLARGPGRRRAPGGHRPARQRPGRAPASGRRRALHRGPGRRRGGAGPTVALASAGRCRRCGRGGGPAPGRPGGRCRAH